MELNPALLKSIAPAGYTLRVPRGSGPSLEAAVERLPDSQRASWRMHLVTQGDTLATIAKRYGSTPKTIADANQLGAASPNMGDRLLIPAAYHPPTSRPVAQTYGSRQRVSAKTATSTTKRVPVHTTPHPAAKVIPAVATTAAPKHKTAGTLAQVR
jgi:membrane-bound lytic murein transglycosylase D